MMIARFDDCNNREIFMPQTISLETKNFIFGRGNGKGYHGVMGLEN